MVLIYEFALNSFFKIMSTKMWKFISIHTNISNKQYAKRLTILWATYFSYWFNRYGVNIRICSQFILKIMSTKMWNSFPFTQTYRINNMLKINNINGQHIF